MTLLQNYTGNKSFPIAYQNIINRIPPHKVYYELFLGSGGVYKHKKKAELSILNDLDPTVIYNWTDQLTNDIKLQNTEAIKLLKNIPGGTDRFIYLDPPYPIQSRFSKKKLYKYEMTDSDHEELLNTARTVKNNCMISTYPNKLYDKMLKGWRKESFKCSVHGKLATELLYMNYEKPKKLHDYSYLGTDCWERQRIKRKIQRHVNRLYKLPSQERYAILEQLSKID